MTKAKFFELLNNMAKRENAKAADFEIYTLVESEERQAELLSIAGRREWLFNAIGFSVRNCWHFSAQDHNTYAAFERNLPKFTRWMNEWRAAKEAEERMDEMKAEALELNAMVDAAVAAGTTANENCFFNKRAQAIAHIRDALFAHYISVQPRFVVKMMISVSRLAREATDRRIAEWKEILARPVSTSTSCDIPF